MNSSIIQQIFNIKNRNFVITGSAGLLGTQFSIVLAKSGANLILVDKDNKKNRHLEKTLISKYKIKAKSYQVDISQKSEVNALCKQVLRDFKTIDGLVNNAAYTTKGSLEENRKTTSITLEKFPIERWQKILDINLTGVFLCSQIFGKVMLKQKRGVIVNISSIYGLVGADHRIYGKTGINVPVAYAATKGSLINLTRYLASYWHRKNIRVNCLSLGGVLDKRYQKNDFIKKYSEKTILGRMANKDEYNGALIFLLSDASSYMTGANLIVDGGWTAW